MNNYREGNREARTDNLRGIDFLLDDEEQILTEESSGFSTFSCIKRMKEQLHINTQRLWEMSPGTPFPSEMEINHNPGGCHASIKPAIGVTVSPERFVKVMSVAQCFTQFQAGSSSG